MREREGDEKKGDERVGDVDEGRKWEIWRSGEGYGGEGDD